MNQPAITVEPGATRSTGLFAFLEQRIGHLRTLEGMVSAALLAILGLLTIVLAAFKLIRLDQRYGDSALYFQVLQSVRDKGVGSTSAFAAITQFFHSHVPTMTAAQMASDPLAVGSTREINYLTFHAHYIFYLIAPLAHLFPVDGLLLTLFVLSFTGILLLAYLCVRSKGVSIAGAVAFCALVVFHPAWSQGFTWQFYPERLFVSLGFLFMWLVVKPGRNRIGLSVVTLLCALLNERTAILAGVFLLLYLAFYWRSASDRTFKVVLGVAFFVCGVVVLKFAISNPEYSTFLPVNFADMVGRFVSIPGFSQKAGMFMLMNAPLLVLALFEWRLAVITFVFMLPNIVGNIGGAEKIGWSTHYHDLYLPAIVFAAAIGYARLYSLLAERNARLPMGLIGGVAATIVVFGMVQPFAAQVTISPVNLTATGPIATIGEALGSLSMSRSEENWRQEIEKAIPRGAVASVPEGVMSDLDDNHTVEMFPIGIDQADYVVLPVAAAGPPVVYGSGFLSYLGHEEQTKADAVLIARMKKDHYDFAHEVLIPGVGSAATLAVVHRGAKP